MSEKSVLLSKLEQEMLVNPEGLSTRQKRNLSYRLKTKSNQIDQVLQEINLLIKNVSDEVIKENISNKSVSSLIEILEKILQVFDPWPIGVDEKDDGVLAFRIYGTSLSTDPGKCGIFSKSRTALQEEIELDYLLTNHFSKIRRYVDPCIPDPVCHSPDYILKASEKIFQIKQELGEPYIEGSAAYTDETGVSEDGWILRERVKIDEKQLQWMRWKPHNLKECMEQPPLLAPRKIPRGPELMHMSMHMGKDGIHYFLSEKGGAEQEITEKEFLEANKKYGMIKEAVHPEKNSRPPETT